MQFLGFQGKAEIWGFRTIWGLKRHLHKLLVELDSQSQDQVVQLRLATRFFPQALQQAFRCVLEQDDLRWVPSFDIASADTSGPSIG